MNLKYSDRSKTGVSFILQTGLGIFGNTVVLLAYASIVSSETKLLPVDMILCHLAFVNLMLLLTRCVPQTMTVFGLRNLLNDPGCKVVIYAYRISRALSVCITCMLSVFQAVTIAPAGPRLSRLKPSLPSLVLPTFAGLWLLNMAICIAAPLFSMAPRNGTVPAFTLNLGFCHVDFRNNLSYVINGVAVSGRDFAFVALMVGSSGYILLLLHRHSKQVKGIRRSQGGGAETRAAKTVLTLVVLYAVFFGIDNVIWIYMLTMPKVSPVVADMRVFFSSCYASLSPYFVISSNKKVKGKIVCSAEHDQPLEDVMINHYRAIK
uniref:Vomeronasal type-1 receptor n=1 Tax=Kryptolebias marmoratus TaxID=37003 RepID=A0A3Q3B0J3_KRYMA